MPLDFDACSCDVRLALECLLFDVCLSVVWGSVELRVMSGGLSVEVCLTFECFALDVRYVRLTVV